MHTKKYLTLDGEILDGAAPLEVIMALRNGSWFASDEDLNTYMAGFAARMKEYDGTVLRHDTPEHLFEDLLACGWLTEIE